METETKAWIPEVGKTAWARFGGELREMKVIAVDPEDQEFSRQATVIAGGEEMLQWVDHLWESPEAYFASIKVVDLEGNPVVVARRQGVFDGSKLHRFLRDEAGQLEETPHFGEILRQFREAPIQLVPSETNRYEEALKTIRDKMSHFWVSADYPDPSDFIQFAEETAENALNGGTPESGKIAKTETSMDMSYNPNSDQSFSGWQQGRDGK